MLENFLTKYRAYTSVPIRVALGIIFIVHGYSYLSGEAIDYANIGLAIIHLSCGLFILFGFFTRYASVIMIIVLLFFWTASHTLNIKIYVTQNMESQLLIIAATITLLFTGSGKLSLENYFGFK